MVTRTPNVQTAFRHGGSRANHLRTEVVKREVHDKLSIFWQERLILIAQDATFKEHELI